METEPSGGGKGMSEHIGEGNEQGLNIITTQVCKAATVDPIT